ncbi:hypothetical protein BJ878DRAFT_426649 [Calycina marina]|uniref:FYVE-type domain-containing protein n=1 Tax=Calycina marina TaxID=1763456 RepID=A0A9P8CE98_9HELO|nr:hypothetical protein BJ878DRAFT_426649 [Calycina marina]
MPVQQFKVPSSQYTLYNYQSHSQQISPVSSATATPTNVSPVSPRAPLPPHMQTHKQLRPPKSPLYVPAVLRPTDPPRRGIKTSPLTPPHSIQSSLDELDSPRILSRRSTASGGKMDLAEVSELEWSDEGFQQVTDLPTREHWKPDSTTQICDEASCTRHFSYFTRRHHCRRCGNIFCDTHSQHRILLDQDANYHPRGTWCRACAHCSNDFKAWQVLLGRRQGSEESVAEEPMTPTTPGTGGIQCMFAGKGDSNAKQAEMAQSVPRDWNWSTF